MTSQTRRVGAVGVMAEQCSASSPRGVIAAAAPGAARIGAAMLDRGGNAFDAVVAACLAETVLLPPKCGLGGDLVGLVWERDAVAPVALLAIGAAPAGLAQVAAEGGLTETGPMSVGVPGAPAGYLALAERGVLELDELARPAIDLARTGFAWSNICTVLAEESAELVRRHQPDGTVYYPAGRPIEPGAVTRLEGLARVLEHFASERDRFLSGPVGRAIVERVRRDGGVLTHADLDTARAEWVPAAESAHGGERLFATPAPTHGPSLLDAVDRFDRSSSDVVGVYRGVAGAIEDRQLSLSDPSGTSMVSAIDADGTMAVVVHSHSYPRFGSGLIVEDFDLILANRAGRGFTPEVGHPNFPLPGRRPATTLHAWGLAAERGWRLLGATPGGANQMPWNAQSLASLVGRGPELDRRVVADAIVGPRWQLDPDGGITIEAGHDDDAVAALGAAGPTVRSVPRWALRSAMQIVADTDRGFLAAADPRTVACVLPL